jgi:tripartite-type tricarboxylate transporter receptor subunit TctC
MTGTPLQPTRRTFLQGGVAVLSAGALAGGPFRRASAADFPSRTIEVIVPTREGGGADRNLRAVTGVWKKYLDGAIFEPGFYPGASGRVGYEVYMGKREPNPHNLLFGNMGPEVLNWVAQPPETFQFPGDYKYFAHVDLDPSVIFVRADGPFQTIEDVVAEGKKRTLSVATSRLAHPASLGVLALGEATGAQFNLIPFSGGRNTIAAVVTGETDIGTLPTGGVVARGDVIRIVLMFDDENRLGEQANNAPVVNDAFGTDLPPLVSSRAFALHSATFEQFPDEVAMLQDSLRQVFDDPEFKEAILQTGAPWEVIQYGGIEECQAYVDNIIELGERFKPMLTGDTDDG